MPHPALRPILTLTLSLAAPLAHAQIAALKPLPSAVALPAPELFAPGVISSPANDGSPTFSPDGRTLLFVRSGANWGVILESHFAGGHWTKPVLASFSGEWPDSSPALSPDGSFLVFVSTRPLLPDPKAPTAANLWRVTHTPTGWTTPVRLPDTVNIGHSIWKPSIATDGSLYFVSIDRQGGKRLYCSHREQGAYQPAQPLPFSDGTTADVDPEISRDGSLLVFCSSGRVPGDTKDHLFVVARKAAGWGPVLAVHYAGDDAPSYGGDQEPHLSPDGRSLYFSSDRSLRVTFPRSHDQAARDLDRLESWDNSNTNVWLLSLAPWLNSGPEPVTPKAS